MTKRKYHVALDMGVVNEEYAVGTQKMYRLNPPLEGREYVIASALTSEQSLDGKPETLIFPSTRQGGPIKEWTELGGGRWIDDCDEAIEDEGYTLDPALFVKYRIPRKRKKQMKKES